jgi:archaellum component FlaC
MMKNPKKYGSQAVLLAGTIALVVFIYVFPDLLRTGSFKLGFSNTGLVWFYNLVSMGILLGAVAIYHYATIDEQKLRELNSARKSPGEIKQWSGLWKVYESTFLHDSRKTTEPAELYFNPDNLLALTSQKIPILPILKAMPGTYTGLGILGTFMGFSAGLSNFNPSTTESMQESIRTLLTGINTAFNTSIIGVVLSIMFNFGFLQPLLKRLEQECQILADRLDAEHYIDSVDHLKEMLAFEEDGQTWLPRDYSREMLAQLKIQSRSLANFTTDLSDSMNNLASALVENYRKQMQEMISADLKPVLASLADSAQRLLAEKMESTDQALDGVVEKLNGALTQFLSELRENLSSQTKQELEGLTNNIKLAGDSLSRFPELMDDLKEDVGYLLSHNEEAMNKITLDSVGLMTETLQDLKEFSNDAKLVMDSFNTAVKAAEGQNQFALRISQSLERVSETAASVTNELNQSFQAYREREEAMLTSISKQTEELRLVTEAVRSASEGFTGLDKSLASSFQAVTEGLEQYRESTKAGLGEYLEQYSTSMQAFAARLSSAVADLSEMVGELHDTLSSAKRGV